MADDLGERTEDPTPKRREEAREEGNVVRSLDLSGAIMLLVVVVILWLGFRPMIRDAGYIVEHVLDPESLGTPGSAETVNGTMAFVANAGMQVALPLLLITWVFAALVQIFQVGFLFSPQAVAPKLSKLNPISGFKRIFGISGLVKAGLDAGKVAVVMVVAVFTLFEQGEQIVLLPYIDLLPALMQTGGLMFDLALRVVIVLLILGLIDYWYQKWKHTQDLRMTKQQVKDEMKQSEGDPETKKRRMRMQQQIAMQRISSAIPQADVIVTNPEHISIALKYDPDHMNAPRVIGKGADLIALRIRQIAIQHGIPIVERKPLARALYREVNVGQEVPAQFFQAVAEILAYVYRLNGRMAG